MGDGQSHSMVIRRSSFESPDKPSEQENDIDDLNSESSSNESSDDYVRENSEEEEKSSSSDS